VQEVVLDPEDPNVAYFLAAEGFAPSACEVNQTSDEDWAVLQRAAQLSRSGRFAERLAMFGRG
jgi:hypothetical protein